jgi:murein DD-endopeptidase MepM/ murein hydrolase activator NlpD
VHWIASPELSTGESHRGYNEFAIDFAMPEGTEVWAARAGTIARVVDGFTECGVPEDRAYAANGVTVLHDDGTFATYLHLRPGISVAEGQPVAVGDLLGYSGCTGHAATPHLHIQVSARRSETRVHSIPLRFDDGTPEGYAPKIWSLYQNHLPATLGLRVSVAGSQLASGRPFPVGDPGSAQLRVEAAMANGSPRDVTRDPGIRYVALTPWSLAVDAAGRVSFGRSKAWAQLPDDVERNFAIVTILYRDAEGREGFFDAWLTPPAVAPEGRRRRPR